MKTISIKLLSLSIIFLLFFSLSISDRTTPVYAEETLNIITTDLFDAIGPGGPNTFDRILIDKNPAWADYRQKIEDMDGEVWTAGQIFDSFAWGYELGTGVNPAVILVTYGIEYDWELPNEGDLSVMVDQIRGSLYQYELEWVLAKVDRSQYPHIDNGATYALYRYFNEDQQKLDEWSPVFLSIFNISPEQPLFKTTSLMSLDNLEPFLKSPFDRPLRVSFFYHLSSFFDHHYPLYKGEGDNRTDLYRFDGTEFEDIPEGIQCGLEGDLGSGTYCYSGHPALDYPVSGGAKVRAAATGNIIYCDPRWGALFIEHGNGLNTSYFHMDPLEIPGGIACRDVSDEQPIVQQGDIIGYVSNKNADNDPKYGIHLHFGVGYEVSISESQNIDPFGWWGDGPDPWKDFQSPDYSGFESKWLWLGDERGDGYLVVDNSETQAQLFNSPYGLGDWNWVESGYPESEGDAWYAHLSYSPKRTSVYWGIWGTNITKPGIYQPQAYWPDDPDSNNDPIPAPKVAYELYYHNQLGNVQSVTLYADQSRNANQFVTLCAVPYDNDPEGCPEYPNISFGAGPSVIILNDVSDDPVEAAKYMVFFDAIQWKELIPTPTPPTPTPPTETPTPPPGTTITVQVDQGNEDAGIEPSSCVFLTTKYEVYIGKCDNGSLITSGFRFGGVPIPPGADIQEAYLEFTVDGTYSLPVTVLISGEDSGDAQPFSAASQPTGRPQTSAGAAWDIPTSEVWHVGDIHRGPEMKAIVQEIVDRSDWASGQGMAFILDTLSSDPGHRRVIGYERIGAPVGTEHAARLVVTYTGGTPPIPTPPTPTTPPPTPTPTTPPSPSPPPEPTCIFENLLKSSSVVSGAEEIAPRSTGTPTVNSLTTSERLVKAIDLAEFAVLLYQVRDEYLSKTQLGLEYTELYYEHTKEIAHILINDDKLYQQGYEILKSLEPALEDLLDGNGDLNITAAQISEIQSFLDGMDAQANPALQEAIQDEMEDRPLEALIGLSLADAWSHLNGYNLDWLPPLGKKDPYEVQINSTIPIRFSIKTKEGKEIKDETVWLQIVDENGQVVVDPIGLGKNPTQEIDYQGKKYHYNLKTEGLEPGLYNLEVYYNSVEPGEPAVWNLLLKEK